MDAEMGQYGWMMLIALGTRQDYRIALLTDGVYTTATIAKMLEFRVVSEPLYRVCKYT